MDKSIEPYYHGSTPPPPNAVTEIEVPPRANGFGWRGKTLPPAQGMVTRPDLDIERVTMAVPLAP